MNFQYCPITRPCQQCEQFSNYIYNNHCVNCYCLEHNGPIKNNDENHKCHKCGFQKNQYGCICRLYLDRDKVKIYCTTCQPRCANHCDRIAMKKCELCDDMLCGVCSDICYNHKCTCGSGYTIYRVVRLSPLIWKCSQCVNCQICLKNIICGSNQLCDKSHFYCKSCCKCLICTYSISRIAPAFIALRIITRHQLPRPLLYMIFNFVQSTN